MLRIPLCEHIWRAVIQDQSWMKDVIMDYSKQKLTGPDTLYRYSFFLNLLSLVLIKIVLGVNLNLSTFNIG